MYVAGAVWGNTKKTDEEKKQPKCGRKYGKNNNNNFRPAKTRAWFGVIFRSKVAPNKTGPFFSAFVSPRC